MVANMEPGGSNNVARLRGGDVVVPQRTPPLNYDAEQALLGAEHVIQAQAQRVPRRAVETRQL